MFISETLNEILTLTCKGLAILIIWLISFVVGIAPLRSKSIKSNVKLMGCFNSFSAGIFLAVGLSFLLPKANDLVSEKF